VRSASAALLGLATPAAAPQRDLWVRGSKERIVARPTAARLPPKFVSDAYRRFGGAVRDAAIEIVCNNSFFANP
jgi:hypothetical protein